MQSEVLKRRMVGSESWKDYREDLVANDWGRNAKPNQPCSDRCQPLASKGFTP